MNQDHGRPGSKVGQSYKKVLPPDGRIKSHLWISVHPSWYTARGAVVSLTEESEVDASCERQARVHGTEWPPPAAQVGVRSGRGSEDGQLLSASAVVCRGRGRSQAGDCLGSGVNPGSLPGGWLRGQPLWQFFGIGRPPAYDPVPEVIVFLGRCGFFGLHLSASYTLSQS